MKRRLFQTITLKTLRSVPRDLLTGIIMAAVSIPIAMGYAQISGLPAVYGLYGSVLPVLIFAACTTSPQIVFGVDAAPAALVGGILASMGVVAGSEEAIALVPEITLFTACWLLLFTLLKAGKLVNYISSPVMGGFITGICITIILMQIPKLMGVEPGSGELFELAKYILKSCGDIHRLSLALGVGSLALLLVGKRLMPKFPMSIVVMILGALSAMYLHVDQYGVALLSAVEPGMPIFQLPKLTVMSVTNGLGVSFTVALVIVAETLLTESSYALKNGDKLDDNQELLAFTLSNFAAACSGCCPVNGSVSRTAMASDTGGRSQLVSVVSAGLMLAMLLYYTDFIGYLPVPVLTAIVIAALIGATEFHLAKRLWAVSRGEFFIFIGAMLGVLILGTVYGVVIGVVLSFTAVLRRAVDPPRAFLGVVPGRDTLCDLGRNKKAEPMDEAVIYRFSGNLFFANADILQADVEDSIGPDTSVVVVDAAGIGHIDITAADRLVMLHKTLKDQGIAFYLTGHIGDVNDQLRTLGAGSLIEEGAVRRSVRAALYDAGIPLPESMKRWLTVAEDSILSEFEWAFGAELEVQVERLALELIDRAGPEAVGDLLQSADHWSNLSAVDESEVLEHLEGHLGELVKQSRQSEKTVEEAIEERKSALLYKMRETDPVLLNALRRDRRQYEQRLREERPEDYERMKRTRAAFIERLEQSNPEAAQFLREWYDEE